jgi:hypothetical protein
MQRMGTEFGREMVHPELWVRRCMNEVAGYTRRAVPVVISDVRFENEARVIRDQGGVIVHVRRGVSVSTDTHVSETPLPVLFGDLLVHNNGTCDDLVYNVLDMVVRIHAQRHGQQEMPLAKPEDRL